MRSRRSDCRRCSKRRNVFAISLVALWIAFRVALIVLAECAKPCFGAVPTPRGRHVRRPARRRSSHPPRLAVGARDAPHGASPASPTPPACAGQRESPSWRSWWRRAASWRRSPRPWPWFSRAIYGSCRPRCALLQRSPSLAGSAAAFVPTKFKLLQLGFDGRAVDIVLLTGVLEQRPANAFAAGRPAIVERAGVDDLTLGVAVQLRQEDVLDDGMDVGANLLCRGWSSSASLRTTCAIRFVTSRVK